eukprot:TRINITY_DN431_c0_g1_i10.p2 TRINITY_DN431_c0_g1~~TRINITY_DN431_c0_g1_i10.p2  ORF type:complete len:109 (+),score=2.76 TRINITY_DN431_c0_g1_i10:935-1261(+)
MGVTEYRGTYSFNSQPRFELYDSREAAMKDNLLGKKLVSVTDKMPDGLRGPPKACVQPSTALFCCKGRMGDKARRASEAGHLSTRAKVESTNPFGGSGTTRALHHPQR